MEEHKVMLQEKQDLLLNAESMQALIENMPYPTLLVTHERIVIAANEKLCKFLNIPYTTTDVRGKNTIEVLNQVKHLLKGLKILPGGYLK
ncbi:MAG TPA: PAS domain-containing protein [Chitinophagaceae bacterium]|nr:PAS domain-containing protein [Chitinophagaceae bacterium]